MDERRPQGAQDPFPAGIRVHAVVPAAGRGERFGAGVPKQFAPLRGRPLIAWTVERLFDAGCATVVVALPGEAGAELHGLVAGERLRLVVGAATRQASVAAALAASPAAAEELVAVHDGARAALAATDFWAVLRAAVSIGGAVLGRQATDTMKRVEGGLVRATVDRASLFRAETPQMFRRADLERALEQARRDRFVGTDEASLVERLGGVPIAAVEARRANPKVTYPEDLALLRFQDALDERILESEERV